MSAVRTTRAIIDPAAAAAHDPLHREEGTVSGGTAGEGRMGAATGGEGGDGRRRYAVLRGPFLDACISGRSTGPLSLRGAPRIDVQADTTEIKLLGERRQVPSEGAAIGED